MTGSRCFMQIPARCRPPHPDSTGLHEWACGMGRVRLYILHFSHNGIRLSASFLGVCRIFRVIRVLAQILEHIVRSRQHREPSPCVQYSSQKTSLMFLLLAAHVETEIAIVAVERRVSFCSFNTYPPIKVNLNRNTIITRP